MQDGKMVRDLVREGLAEGPRTKAELKSAIDCLDDDKQLANALYRLKHEGELTQDGDGRYHLVEPGQRQAPARAGARKATTRAGKKPAGSRRTRAPAGASEVAPPRETVLEHMRAAARSSDAALIAYITNLGDPVLDALIAGARSAREQLDVVEKAPRA